MPSQDLLFSILPRAPATPGGEGIKREVTRISKKHRLRQAGAEQNDAQAHQQAYPAAKGGEATTEADEYKPDPAHQIDLFV